MAQWWHATRRPPLTRVAIDLLQRSFRIEAPIELGDVQAVLLPLQLRVVQRAGVPQLAVPASASAAGHAHPALGPVGLGVRMVRVGVRVLRVVVAVVLLWQVLVRLVVRVAT